MPQLHPGMSENQTIRGRALGAKSEGKSDGDLFVG
jgi:hypothetical protein